MKIIVFIFLLSLFIQLSFQAAYIVAPTDKNCAASKFDDKGQEISCIRCITGYTLANGLCVDEIPNCYEYEDTSSGTPASLFLTLRCKTCAQNFVKTVTGKNCIVPIPNCLIHLDSKDFTKTKVCAQCATGFVPSSVTSGSMTCVKAVPNCNYHNAAGNCTEIKGCRNYELVPSSSNYLKCTDCMDDLKLSASGLFCVPFIHGCNNIYEDDGTCRTCNKDLSLSKTRRSCFSQDATCAEMNDFGICIKCLNPTFVPYVQKASDCVGAGGVCSSLCVAPKQGCAFYDASGNCLRCTGNLILTADGYCVTPIPQCVIASHNADGSCKACISKYAPDNAVRATACYPEVPNCDKYDLKNNGVCQTCASGYVYTIISSALNAPLVPTLVACRTTVSNCATYDKTTDACGTCNVLYSLYSGKCYKTVANCAKYDDNGCSECSAKFAGFQSDTTTQTAPYAFCVPIVENCKVQNYKGYCTECNTNFFISGSSRVCLKEITGCTQYDEIKGANCIKCDDKKYLSYSGTSCYDTEIVNCHVYDDNDKTKCAICADGFNLKSDRTGCVAYEGAAATAPSIYFLNSGQIIFSTGTTTKTYYCLTHKLGKIMADNLAKQTPVTEIDLATADYDKTVSFQNCDEVDYRNTLWQVLLGDGTVPSDKSKLVLADGVASLSVSFAAYYPAGTDGAFPIKMTGASDTLKSYQLRLNVVEGKTLTASTMGILDTKFAVFTVAKTSVGFAEPFNPGFTIKYVGSREITSPTKDADGAGTIKTQTDAATAAQGFLNYVSSSPFYNFLLSAPTPGYFDYRQVYLDATEKNAEPFKLDSQVSFSYYLEDDSIIFTWNIAKTITDMYSVFPAVMGDININAADRTSISSVCNSRFGLDTPSSGWQRGYGKEALVSAELNPLSYKQIILQMPLFDLFTKCGFVWKTLSSKSDLPLLDAGGSYLKGKIGFYTISKDNSDGKDYNHGDGLFEVLYVKLNTMKAYRNIYIDNPSSYQWYNKGNREINVKFNSQIRFFSASQELAGFANAKDQRVVVPSAGLQAKLTLVSSIKSDVSPSEQSDDSLNSNIRAFKELKESFTFTSIVLKLVKKTAEVDITKDPSYFVTTITTIAAANIKASTEKNSVYFDIDLTKVNSGKYDVIVEYKVFPVGRGSAGKRVLNEKEGVYEIQENPEIKHENQEIAAEDFIGLTGSVPPFKLEYLSNFGMKMTALFSFLIVLILGMI